MRGLDIQAAIGTAILLLSLPCDAKHSHVLSHLDVSGKGHNHKRIHASHRVETIEDGLEKRGSCTFPTDAGLVAVTPGSSNAGWAMSPDQPCTPGNYCPYACPSGQVMAQWNPLATSYTYPLSMDGGLFCDSNGQISKPFPDQPYCVDGTGTVGAQNTLGSTVSFCQTVLPGNEAMLIPTQVDSWSQLAVPGISYWCSTSAEYYINPPGVSTEDACVWGDGSSPIGNWSPYVGGANTDGNGNTFVQIGWNPIWTGSGLANTPPTFGVKIICSGSGCNGTPCSIDPSVNGVGGVTSSDQSTGAGGASFCVVTVPQGETANIVVFQAGNSNSGSGSPGSSESSPSPTTTPNPTPTPTLSSTKTSSPSSSSASHSSSSSTKPTTSLITLKPTSSIYTTSIYPNAENSPHILFQNDTIATSTAGTTPTGTAGLTGNDTVVTPTAASSKTSAASGTFISSAFLSLAALFAGAYIF